MKTIIYSFLRRLPHSELEIIKMFCPNIEQRNNTVLDNSSIFFLEGFAVELYKLIIFLSNNFNQLHNLFWAVLSFKSSFQIEHLDTKETAASSLNSKCKHFWNTFQLALQRKQKEKTMQYHKYILSSMDWCLL